MLGRSPRLWAWHRSALATSSSVAVAIVLGGAGPSAGGAVAPAPSRVAHGQSIDDPGRTAARPPVPRGTNPATDQMKDGEEVPKEPVARFVACECRSILGRQEVEVPWRGEIELLRDEAKACRQGVDDIAFRAVEWTVLADRLPADRRSRDALLEGLRARCKEITDAVAGLQARLEALSDRLEAPSTELPEAIREALAAAARASPPRLSLGAAGAIQPARDELVLERTEVAGALAALLDAGTRLERHVDRLDEIAREGIDIWAWSQHLAIRKVPQIPEEQALDAAAMEVRRDALASWLRLGCAIDAYLAGAAGRLRRTGLEAPWPQLLAAALPSTLVTTRSGIPDLRESFLAKLVDDGAMRPERQVAFIEANARRSLGRWLQESIEPVDPLGDPDLMAMRTCLLQLAGLLQEGRSLSAKQESNP